MQGSRSRGVPMGLSLRPTRTLRHITAMGITLWVLLRCSRR